ITGPPRGKFKVLKVSNRTLDVSERQGSGDGSHESQGSYGSHGLLPSACFLLARHFLLPIVQFRLMDADLKTMVDAGKIDVKTADAFAHLKPKTFCLHKSWGFGQINSWNLLLNQIVVDFDTKKNHAMQLTYAAETLQPLPDTHIFVRKLNEPETLRELAANNIPQLVELVLESFGGKVTQEQLQRALAPEIIAEGDFKKWWE